MAVNGISTWTLTKWNLPILIFFKDYRVALTLDSLGREILSIAIPVTIALAADPVASLVDTMYIGHIGSVEIAAVGISIALFNQVSKVVIFPLVSVTTSFVAEEETIEKVNMKAMEAEEDKDVENSKNCSTEKDDEKELTTLQDDSKTIASKNIDPATNVKIAKRNIPSASTALLFGLALGVLETLFLALFAKPLLSVTGVKSGSPMLKPAHKYLTLRSLGAPAVLVSLAVQGVFRGFKDTKTPLYATVAGDAANIILDPILIFTCKLGVSGAAIAHVLSQYLISLILLVKLMQQVNLLPLSTKSLQFNRFLKSGSLLLFRVVAATIPVTLAASLATKLGATTMAAFQICLQVWLTSSLLSDGLAVAGQWYQSQPHHCRHFPSSYKAIKLQGLRREFENLMMKEDEAVGDYFSRVMTIVSQRRSYGEPVTDQTVVEKILRSLTPRFHYIVPSIEVSNDLSQLAPVKLMGSLQSHEARINNRANNQAEKPEEQALQKDCWFNEENQAQVATDENPQAPAMHEEPHLFFALAPMHAAYNSDFALVASTGNVKNNAHLWFMDSGCSNHMTGSKESFTVLDETFKLEVNLGDKKKLGVESRGTVKIPLKNDKYKLLDDVYYAPRLEYNLLSVGQLMKKGYSLMFEDGKCTIKNKMSGINLMAINVSNNNMFLLDASQDTGGDEPSPLKNSNHTSKLWHLRYGHLNYQGLKQLSDKKMVQGLPPISLSDPCEGCIMGKQHKLPFQSKSWKATVKLGLIHADLCGPMQVPSLGGSYYDLLLIDDYTRMNWVHFIKHKSEAFYQFERFKALVERESNCYIKVLRTDRGGEFCSSEFNQYCDKWGIRRELTIPYTPEHNGVVERKNRTIMGLTRSMLKHKEMLNHFWAEGVATAVYLLNRSPTKARPNKTPVEEWGGIKPSVQHLRIFGCVAYSLIPSQQRQKLDHRSEKCLFVGYSQQSNGYRLYNPISKKFSVQKHVVFEEDSTWEWHNNGTKEPVLGPTHFSDPFPYLNLDSDHTSESSYDNLSASPTQPISHTSTLTNLPTLPNHLSQPNLHNPSTSHQPSIETTPGPSKRTTRPPGWLRDYHTGSESTDEETQLLP
ncbi:hypothetical protein E3N88_14201 [Mikania micrantha]|uniref:Protein DETOXIFICATION n=1 Tax=Mikania micrantha TaxID=192012 RepID=A0A5N6P2G7_9ASTR|nr:hypothetical protein E3N88_14201 [Mikania micrantha]